MIPYQHSAGAANPSLVGMENIDITVASFASRGAHDLDLGLGFSNACRKFVFNSMGKLIIPPETSFGRVSQDFD